MAKLLTKRVKTENPAGGVNPALEPNAGQFGWTQAEAAHVKQLIGYVDAARKSAESSKADAEYVESVRKEMAQMVTEINDLKARVTALENKP